MRKGASVLAAALVALALASPTPAEAGHRRAHVAWGEVETGRTYGYYPGYRHFYAADYRTDPYAYHYVAPNYYPYYNSDYWRPAAYMRWRRACCQPVIVLPPYYQAWGYPDRRYVRSEWTYRHFLRD